MGCSRVLTGVASFPGSFCGLQYGTVLSFGEPGNEAWGRGDENWPIGLIMMVS